MKSHHAAIAFIFLLCFAAGCAVVPRTSPATLTADHPSDDVRAGGKLFAQHCAACHGIDAGGARGPSLHTPSVQAMDDAALVQFLTDGDLRRGMPSWSRLPAERRWQLTRFVKSLPTAEGEHAK